MSNSKTIEETYKKLSQREHILTRGNMYIGSTKKQLEEQWVAEENVSETGMPFRMKKQMVEYTPGFMKIFDEILTNATDHATRDPTVNLIKVDFDQTTGLISVWNNGKGIPVVLHKDHNMYVPELIFGHFLSGSNYNDNDVRTGAGTNGVGSKCTAVYSKRFVVETIDSENQKKFIQEFTDNMANRTKPKVTTNSGKSYTKITFLPDYARFGMTGLESDAVSLITKRVLDCIACTSDNVQVCLNGQKLKGKGLIDYTKYFFDIEKTRDLISESFVLNQFIWEWAIVPSDTFEQISFVNGNSTTQGGKHVDFLLNQIVSKLKHLLETKKKLKDVKPSLIKERLFLFLRATIVNPSFNSQTKEFLTTPPKDFGCRFEVSDKFIDKLYKSSIVEDIIQSYKLKESLELAKSTNGKKVSRIFIPKLEDAIWAGTAKSDQCTLVLTEGDSAKTFAMWGRSIVGNERVGILPLKGKGLNVRDATVSQLMNNEELNNLKQIIGLKAGKEYTNTSDLRYGKVMVLTDADSVTYDTPCILKNKKTGEIEIKPICEINDDSNSWVEFNGKEYNTCSEYLVWSDNEWTTIKSVMRHKVDKPIHRVLTHTGCVDVTEDHSLLDKNGNELTVKDCTIKQTELLHKKLSYFTKENKYNITKEYAWALGYFQADGSCSTDSKVRLKRKDGSIKISYNYHWNICCIDKNPLEKLKKIFDSHFKDKGNMEFRITERKCSKNSFSEKMGRQTKFILELYGSRKDFCIQFRNMFYNSLREKKVPTEILNNTIEIQQSFIDGFYAGDGNKGSTRTTDHFDGTYKTQICGLFQLLQNCGYTPSLNCSNTKLNVYSVHMSKDRKSYWRPEHTVKKILNVSEKYKNTYVYDFETENHHFHASIGNMIVHNTDGLMCSPEKHPANN